MKREDKNNQGRHIILGRIGDRVQSLSYTFSVPLIALNAKRFYLVWFEVYHTTATDSSRGGLLQIGWLEYQTLPVVHLNDFTAHQTQLKNKRKED